MEDWLDVPEYMQIETPEEFREKRLQLFKEEFSDKLADAKRHARAFRHCQLGYRETESNHILGSGVPEWHIVCELDGQSILRIQSGGQPFNFDPLWVETSVIRHLFQCHPEITGVKESNERGENKAMDRPGSGLLRNQYDRTVPRLRNQEGYPPGSKPSTRRSRQTTSGETDDSWKGDL